MRYMVSSEGWGEINVAQSMNNLYFQRKVFIAKLYERDAK